MRVTNRMLTTTVVRNINHSLERLQKTQQQMSSGKLVSRPGDDPVALARILSFRSTLREAAQHRDNMQDAMGWLDATDQALNEVGQVLQRVRELAVYGANGTVPRQSLEAMAAEVDELANELLQAANASYSGRYIFAGSRTTSVPFTRTGDQVNYAGDDLALTWEVAPGVSMPVNQTGQKVFEGNGASPNVSQLFATVFAVKQALQAGDQAALSGSLLADLDGHIDQVLSRRAEVGARVRRMELATERADQNEVKLRGLISQLEDVDIASVVMDYKMQQNVYEAALATAAQIIQPSLVNFLR